jgi:hypothetical protein
MADMGMSAGVHGEKQSRRGAIGVRRGGVFLGMAKSRHTYSGIAVRLSGVASGKNLLLGFREPLNTIYPVCFPELLKHRDTEDTKEHRDMNLKAGMGFAAKEHKNAKEVVKTEIRATEG